MRTTALVALALAPVLFPASCAPTGDAASADLDAGAGTITAADMYDRIAFLASDELQGRDTPSPGLETAARWVADELASFGLEPAGDDGTWLQRYPYPAVGLDAVATELMVTDGATHTFAYGADYFAQGGAPVDGPAELVFVGREVPADMDLEGRIPIVRLPGLPEETRRGYVLDRQARSEAAAARAAAAKAGAGAVIFALDAGVTAADMERLAASAESPSRSLGEATAQGIPAFYLSRAGALRIFRMADVNGEVVLTETDPLPLTTTARPSAPSRVVDDARPPNVVGVLPGRDPELRDTYVVITAHMDHVGVGRPDATGDSIFNGADDDASGTAALVEVAQALASLPEPPLRSVLFVAVSGEEKGLLGSRWYADHPTVPLESMVANVNLDMVSRNAPDSIVVIGQEYSTLGPLVRQVARSRPDLGLTPAEDLWPEQRFFFRSDHFSFAAKEIPALFFFAGVHNDYHRPSDEVDTVDTDKAARVARLVYYLTHAVADAPGEPDWDPDGLATVRDLTGS